LFTASRMTLLLQSNGFQPIKKSAPLAVRIFCVKLTFTIFR
jgi:hypothetical protein